MISQELTIFIIIIVGLFLLIIIGFLVYHFYLSDQNKAVGDKCSNTAECSGSNVTCLQGVCTRNSNANNPSNPVHGAGGTSAAPDGPLVGGQCTMQNCSNNNCSTTNIYCGSDFRCHCGIAKIANESCSSNSDCNLGLYCSGSNLCMPRSDDLPLGNGQSCQNSTQCQVGSYCDFQKTCQSGMDQVSPSFKKMSLEVVAVGPNGYLSIVNGKLSVQCTSITDDDKPLFSYNNGNLSVITATGKDMVVVGFDGVPSTSAGQNPTIVARILTRNGEELLYFTDQFGNVLQADTDSLSCFYSNASILTWFYDPVNYEQEHMDIFATTPQLFRLSH